MAFDPDAWLAQNLDAHGDLAPPWARYPEIPSASLGWRMGGGEGWLMAWHRWVPTLPADAEARLAYLRRHPPAPRTWMKSALWVLEPTLDEDDDEGRRAAVAVLEREGLVADDAAFGAWVARNEIPQAPWCIHDSVADAVRYGARELGFLVRWAMLRRAEGRLDAWLDPLGSPPDGWRGFVEALREGKAPDPLPSDARERLAVLLAATGRPPAPWTTTEPPAALDEHFEDPTTYGGAWVEWAMEIFDEPATFAAYLDQEPSLPEPWRPAVADAVGWLL